MLGFESCYLWGDEATESIPALIPSDYLAGVDGTVTREGQLRSALQAGLSLHRGIALVSMSQDLGAGGLTLVDENEG